MPQLLIFSDLAVELAALETALREHAMQLIASRPNTQSQTTEELWVNADGAAIAIEQVRELLGALSYSATRPRIVYLVDVHRASEAAQQALLKTLEEPPLNTLFVLSTNQADALLPTIRSRCVEIRIQSDAGEHSLSAEVLEKFAALSSESLGKAVQQAETYSDRAEARALVIAWLSHTTQSNTTSSRAPHLTHLLTAIQQLDLGANVKLVMADLAIKLTQSVV